MYKLSQKSKDNRKGVDPRLVDIFDIAIQITKIDFGIPPDGGVRTAERQHELYLDGKSKADGYNKLSKHQIKLGEQYSKALDFYAYIDGKASWRHDHLAMVVCALLQAASELGYELDCGILWTSTKKTNGIPYGWDAQHVQLV